MSKTTNNWSKRGKKFKSSNNKSYNKTFWKNEDKKIQKEKFGTNTSKDNLTLKYLKLNEI